MNTGTPTIWNAVFTTAKARGLPINIPTYSTINEVINDGVLVPSIPSVPTAGMEMAEPYNYTTDSDLLKVTLFCIGNGGHRQVNGGTGVVPIFTQKPHRATDAALYHMIPFVVKPIAFDLTGADRAKFRLRRTLSIGGDLYAAYFGRVLPVATGDVDMEQLIIQSGGNQVKSIFTPSINNLRITEPPLTGSTDTVYVSSDYQESLTFSDQDVTWLEEACTLLYGDPNYAMVSEVAICTGADKPITEVYPATGTQTPAAPTGATRYETVGCQVYTFNYVEHKVAGSPSFNWTINTAVSEPLLT